MNPNTPDVSLRVPMLVQLVLHTVFTLLRDALSPLFTDEALDRLDVHLARGELAMVLAALDGLGPVAVEDLPGHRALEASHFLHHVIATAQVGIKASKVRRSFFAQVQLMGHCDLGLCRVVEEELAGAEVLRCERITLENPTTHWLRAQSIWQIEEVPEAEAWAAVAKAAEDRERERARQKELARQKEERQAARLALRAGATATVHLCGRDVVVKSTPGALRPDHEDIPPALAAAGIQVWQTRQHRDAEDRIDGFTVSDESIEQVVAVVERLGFASVEVLPATEAPASGDNDSDEEPF